MKSYNVAIQMKAVERAVLSCGAGYCAVQDGSNL